MRDEAHASAGDELVGQRAGLEEQQHDAASDSVVEREQVVPQAHDEQAQRHAMLAAVLAALGAEVARGRGFAVLTDGQFG
jgi:hypothetical protein